MALLELSCVRCGLLETNDFFYGCRDCGSRLEVAARPAPIRSDHPGVWRALGDFGVPALPIVSLDEGRTPLIEGVRRRPNLHVKFEGASPTGSWKDRLHAVNTTVARYLGLNGLSVLSTGNSALAAAAYANRAGLDLHAWLSPRTPRLFADAIRQFGFEVEGEGGQPFDARSELQRGYLPATMSLMHDGVANPFGIEGYKTIAYEIVSDLGEVPEWVAVPVGCGDGLYGIYKGFQELRQWGVTNALPRMLAVESDQAASMAAAMHANETSVAPVTVGYTIALSIAVETTSDHALAAVRSSHGTAVTVTDDEIRSAQYQLRCEGIAAEASSAAAWAGATAAIERGEIGSDATVVVIVSSNAYRWLD